MQIDGRKDFIGKLQFWLVKLQGVRHGLDITQKSPIVGSLAEMGVKGFNHRDGYKVTSPSLSPNRVSFRPSIKDFLLAHAPQGNVGVCLKSCGIG